MPVQSAAGRNTRNRPQESAQEPPLELEYDYSSISPKPGIPDISDWEEIQDGQTEEPQSSQQEIPQPPDKPLQDNSLGMVECSPDSVLGL